MKKICFKRNLVSFMCAAALLFSTFPAFAQFHDVTEEDSFKSAIERLSNYGIIGGFDGYFNPYNNLTRAEFAKIATIVGGLDKEVAGNSSIKRFTDTEPSYWANGFINTVAKNQIITGYLNGTYGPENDVTFGEAVTIVLRLLNYTTSDLGDNWPASYINKGRELGLIDHIEQDAYSSINRADIAIMIERALNTDLKGSTLKLLSKMEFTQTEECIITATKNENAALKADEIITSTGTYQIASGIENILLMSKVKLVLNKDKKVVEVLTVSTPRSERVIVDSIWDDVVVYTTAAGTREEIKLESNSVIYHLGTAQSFNNIMQLMEKGSELTLYYADNGNVDYAMLKSITLSAPVVASSDINASVTSISGLSFNSNATVIKNGYASKLTDIKQYDVVYYANVINTLYVYSDKISGVYEKAYPSKAAVTSIKLSGNELAVETQTAGYKLGENPGSFGIGSRITALLGRDGKIVDVVNLNTGDVSNIGVVLSVASKISEETETKGRSDLYTAVLTGNGNVMEYKSDKNYTNLIGKVVKMTFNGEFASFSSFKTNPITGKVDKANRKIGDKILSGDAKILEIINVPISGAASAHVIELSNILYSELTDAHVIHAETDSKFGDITLMVVQNITQSQLTFGYMSNKPKYYSKEIKDEDGNVTGTRRPGYEGNFEIYINGVKNTYPYSGSKNFSAPVGGVGVKLNGNSLEEVTPLYEIPTNGSFTTADPLRIKIGSDIFNLAPDVQIYKKNYDYTLSAISINDIPNYKMSGIKMYSDEKPTHGGLVRIIVFND